MKLHVGARDGFFYRNIYFLPPSEEISAEDFLSSIRKKTLPAAVKAVVLPEDAGFNPLSTYRNGVCLAPHFIKDYIKRPEQVTIESIDEIYPVRVELITQQRYNKRLRELVVKRCPGCLNLDPLTEYDNSLNPHFDKMPLKGPCFYRCEFSHRPMDCYQELMQLCNRWKRHDLFERKAEWILDDLQSWLMLSIASGEMVAEDDRRTLIVSAKRNSTLLTVMIDVINQLVKQHLSDDYEVRLTERADISEAAIARLLSKEQLPLTRRELKRCGLAIGIFEYDPTRHSEVRRLMDEMSRLSVAHPMLVEPGRCTLLLMGRAQALMYLRRYAPMLTPCDARITVYDPFQIAQYRISFDMPETILERAPVRSSKPKVPIQGRLRVEADKILGINQASLLFQALSRCLADETCDHTLRFTERWLQENVPPDQYQATLDELEEMGGLCDCTVLTKCYPEYDLDEETFIKGRCGTD